VKDRAIVVTNKILAIVRDCYRGAKPRPANNEIAALLRDEFAEVEREAINNFRNVRSGA
jgi:hypothetical protein